MSSLVNPERAESDRSDDHAELFRLLERAESPSRPPSRVLESGLVVIATLTIMASVTLVAWGLASDGVLEGSGMVMTAVSAIGAGLVASLGAFAADRYPSTNTKRLASGRRSHRHEWTIAVIVGLALMVGVTLVVWHLFRDDVVGGVGLFAAGISAVIAGLIAAGAAVIENRQQSRLRKTEEVRKAFELLSRDLERRVAERSVAVLELEMRRLADLVKLRQQLVQTRRTDIQDAIDSAQLPHDLKESTEVDIQLLTAWRALQAAAKSSINSDLSERSR